MLPIENQAVFSAYRAVGLENIFPMLLKGMGVKQWVCQQSLECSCLPEETHSLGMACSCEADALNAKIQQGAGRNKKKK